MSFKITIEGSDGPIDVDVIRDQVGLNQGEFRYEDEHHPKSQLWRAEHALVQAVASAAVVNPNMYADIISDAKSAYMDALVANGVQGDAVGNRSREAEEKLRRVFGISEREVSKAWNGSQVINASRQIQAISDRHRGGEVQASYNRKGHEVLLQFKGAHTEPQEKGIVAEVERVVGDRNSNFRKALMGGSLVLRMPAQVYVDKLEGEVPGLKRSR